MNDKYQLIFCVVNSGCTDLVMEAAKECGVGGGTYIPGSGTANLAAEEFFNIKIEPEKDIVLMIVPEDIKDDVLKKLYEKAGLGTEGKGIAFSVPVEDVVGIKPRVKLEENKQ